ncbi:putative ATP-dependent RNA helicase DHR1 [Agyrium rufum]|nr:putative ATP-dependent RNA helicase DHR1 [Agyrium rufum]
MPRFVPRERKHKIQKRKVSVEEPERKVEQSDSNITELPSRKEFEQHGSHGRDAKSGSAASKMSAKKRKRLDKYIETKLKKEENVDLLRKLAQSTTDSSSFRSSKDLSLRRRTQRSNVERRSSTEDLSSGSETLDRAAKSSSNDAVDGATPYTNDSSQEHTGKSSTSTLALHNFTGPQPSWKAGNGLKRSLKIDESGNPILQKRRKSSHIVTKIQKPEGVSDTELASWDGFSSDEVLENYFEGDVQSDNELENVLTDTESDSDSQSVVTSISTDQSDPGTDSVSGMDSNDASPRRSQARSKERSSAFKSWAMQQMNEALDYQPSGMSSSTQFNEIPLTIQQEHATAYQPSHFDQSVANLPTMKRRTFNVPIMRSSEAIDARLKLPVVAMEQTIMEAIHSHPVVIIWGSTGSGKTTQVPQFLFEAGYGDPNSPNSGMIGITQPRRVAAVSMSKRVADEMGQLSDRVSYQIRFDSTTSSKTALKFMTDGILIREIAQDFSLSKYSAIVLDEAHERSTNTDILIGMVSRIVDLRASMHKDNPQIAPLKMIIMSATLRISDFLENTNLFRSGIPPLIEAEGRQFPVTIHFTRQTNRDYIEETFTKITRGHKKLPPGGILVFLTGQKEISALINRLKEALPTTSSSTESTVIKVVFKGMTLEAEDLDIEQEQATEDTEADLKDTFEPTAADEDEFEVEGESLRNLRAHILPLYSQLPTQEQLRVFEPPPEASRLIVLATNVAETSLTIPGIRYVFDTGRSKEKHYDQLRGIQSFSVDWISKANAAQRAGRAGRTEPGHCYRLYSSAVYERDFDEHPEPEILRSPVEGVVLQLKSMDLQNIVNFPFPTPPDRQGLINAERLLKHVGGLDRNGKITALGKDLSMYPLSPRLAKILLLGHQQDCMPFAIALVAALVVPEILIPQEATLTHVNQRPDTYKGQEDEAFQEQRSKKHTKARTILSSRSPRSDALMLLTALCAYAYANSPSKFCEDMFLRHKGMAEAAQLRAQLSAIVHVHRPELLGTYESRLPNPSDKQLTAIRQMLVAGYIDQVAIRADLSPHPPDLDRKPRRAIDVPYLTLLPSSTKNSGSSDINPVYIHPSSVLARLSIKDLPKYIIYVYLQRSNSSTAEGDSTSKIRMHPLTSTSSNTLTALADGTDLLDYGKPIGKVISLGGRPERRECWVVPTLIGQRGQTGWPLHARKVLQVKRESGWIVEKIIS